MLLDGDVVPQWDSRRQGTTTPPTTDCHSAIRGVHLVNINNWNGYRQRAFLNHNSAIHIHTYTFPIENRVKTEDDGLLGKRTKRDAG